MKTALFIDYSYNKNLFLYLFDCSVICIRELDDVSFPWSKSMVSFKNEGCYSIENEIMLNSLLTGGESFKISSES